MDGFIVKRMDMPRPSNASLHVPSERVFQSPLDFPNSLVCILEDAVSKGCKIHADVIYHMAEVVVTEDCVPNNKESVSLDAEFK